MDTRPQEKPRKKKRLLKIIAAVVIVCTGLLIGGYLLLTSQFFITSFVLPRLANAAGCEITAKTAYLSLLSSNLELTGVRLGPEKEPFVTGDIKGSFTLGEIISGNIKVDDVVLDNVTLNLRQDAKGKWIFPFRKKSAEQTTAVKPPEKKSDSGNAKKGGVTLDINNAKIKKLDVLLELAQGGSVPAKMTLQDISLDVPFLKTNKLSQFKLTGNLSAASGNNIKIDSAKLNIGGSILLPDNFIPETVNLQLSFSDFHGEVNQVKLDKNRITILLNAVNKNNTIDISNLMIRQINGGIRTNIKAEADIGLKPFSIKAAFKMHPVSDEFIGLLCNFIGGYNPGHAKLTCSGSVEYAKEQFSAKGDLFASRSGTAIIAGTPYELPDFDLQFKYDILSNLKKSDMLFNELDISLWQDRRKVLALSLPKDSTLTLDSNDSHKARPLNAHLIINQLNLKLAQLFIRPKTHFKINSGQLSSNLILGSDGMAENLSATGQINISEFSCTSDNFNLKPLDIVKELDFSLKKLRSFNARKLNIKVSRNQKLITELDASGSYIDLKKLNGLLRFKAGMQSNAIAALPLPDKAKQDLNKIEPFQLELHGDTIFDVKRKTALLKTPALVLNQSGSEKIKLYPEADIPINWSDPSKFKSNSYTFNLDISKLSLTQFNHYLKTAGANINQGELNSKLKINLSSLGKHLEPQGKISLSGMSFDAGGKRFNNLRLDQTLNIEIAEFKNVKIKRLTSELFSADIKALHLETSGEIDSSGDMQLKTYLDYLNQSFAELFIPGKLTSLGVSGSVSMQLNNATKALATSCKLNVIDLRTPDTSSPVAGTINFDLKHSADKLECKNAVIYLKANHQPMVQLQASVKTANDAAKTIYINLNSTCIDLKLIEALFASPESKPPPKAPDNKTSTGKTEYAKFDIGSKLLFVNADLRGITYGKNVNGAVLTKISGQGDTIKIVPLQILFNGKSLDINGIFKSTSNGIAYKIAGSGKQIELTPLFRAMIKGEFRNTEGFIDSLDFDVSGTGTKSPALWDNLNGTLKLNMSKLSIPNTLRDTYMGRLLFMPFDVLIQLEKLVPSLSTTKVNDSLDYAEDLFTGTRTIRFNSSEIALNSKDRLIHIDKCEFQGDFIRSLSFDGYFGLGSDKRMQLKSNMNINRIYLPVDISGSIENPKTDVVKIIPYFLKVNTLNILDPSNIPAIIKGTEKGVKGILDTLLPGSSNSQDEDNGQTQEQPSEQSQDTEKQKKSTNPISNIKNIIKSL